MSAQVQNSATVPCRDGQGREVATVRIWSARKANGPVGGVPDLICWSHAEADLHSEEPVQLRERGRYLYQISSEIHGLTLLEERGITRSPVTATEGFIEPGDQCGVLPLTLMRGDAVAARGAVEVRSVKLNYREHYRGMLDHIAKACAGLLLDSRAPTRLRLSSAWKDNRAMLEQQLEFLRHMLESASFRGALDEVLRNPHRQMEDVRQEQSISLPFKAGKDFAKQVSKSGAREALSKGHPLRVISPVLKSLPSRIQVIKRSDFLDTAENRFVKMVLVEFRDFLAKVAGMLGREAATSARINNSRILNEVARLRGSLDSSLGRSFLPDISRPEILPIGSPVLQRKAGYRELLHFWLQFHVGAQLAWDGGREIWHGGARDVATLYEYWLFFQLEALFRKRFACSKPLHSILLKEDAGLPRLKLERGIELRAPIGGTWSESARRPLMAEFHFNRKFNLNKNHNLVGSWTRGVQPDYTISIWPAEFGKDEAEACDAIVHVHFDAKYRMENVRDMLGEEDDDEVIQDRAESGNVKPTSAKYADLLKMHAYRDAIRRTAGAYVLYPGYASEARIYEQYTGFHELLPGLGAFAIRPRKDGSAEGIEALRNFLDQVIEHLSNRTTARERASYHIGESYMRKDEPVAYKALKLREKDLFGESYRALPPSEHMILIAWCQNESQLRLAESDQGYVYVRLGRRGGGGGSLHVHPNLARARNILLRTGNAVVAPGLVMLREPGFHVYTLKQLRAELNEHAKGLSVAAWNPEAGVSEDGDEDGDEYIYALFKTRRDPAYEFQEWDGDKIMDLIEAFETDVRNKPVKIVGRTSPHPRIIPLSDLLKAQSIER